MCCALRDHFEDIVLGTCSEIAHDMAIFETRIMLSLWQYTYANSRVIRRRDLVFTIFVAFLSMRLDMLETCVHDRLTNNYRRNWSWSLDVMRRIGSKSTREYYFIVTGQNLNQLRQKHLRDVRAFEHPREVVYIGRLQLSPLPRISSRDSGLF